MPAIRSDIEAFDCLVRREYLYDMKQGHGEFNTCKVLGASSYKGHLLTFDILVEGKYMFHYIPVRALASTQLNPLDMTECNYFNCPSEIVMVHIFNRLRGQKCYVYNRDGKHCGQGIYKMTFDWPNDNQLCHLIDSNNFRLWPSHKVVFDKGKEVPELPGFKKMHSEWKLP